MKVKKIEPIFKKHHTLEEITLETDNGEIFTRERLLREDAVACLVQNTNTGKFVFVKQWRPGSMRDAIEIPAGKIDEGEDKLVAMKRELVEEIGYKVDSITEIIPEYYSSIGYTNEKLTIYFAKVSKKIAKGGGVDEYEDIEIVEMDLNETSTFLNDAKSIMAINKYRLSYLY